ncbi:hypothetical protein VZT92_001566 [Zoarces viviparus]|uniref:Uncharacterized protein n=1 Tax=Zoarces viviparus TaxID=48416 RepID=A0AAW1G3K4_ZOAVI
MKRRSSTGRCRERWGVWGSFGSGCGRTSYGPGGDQGILLEHHEKEFGNKVQIADVLEAVKKIVPAE